ncbi:MAG: energy transducer TonB [Thermoanaerobaculia bacterium]|nr:energy transducer TonB [Thermoanaerobaculia bacterium]
MITLPQDNCDLRPIIFSRLLASFVVDRHGKVSDVRIEESVSPEIDKETLRVIRKMPRWEPGRINGIPIRVRYTIPVLFRLE